MRNNTGFHLLQRAELVELAVSVSVGNVRTSGARRRAQ